MDTPTIIGLVVLVVVLAAAAVVLIGDRRRSERLRNRFGPEYDRTVEERGDRRDAEKELMSRERRRERLDIRPLDPETRQQYIEDWRVLQGRFVDEPVESVQEAHGLVTSVMTHRGYPMDDFEQRAADISVDHPQIVEDYRAAYRIARDSVDGRTGTEDLRHAMVRYRALFAALLDTDQEAPSGADTSHSRRTR
jgi:hypothetical protein